MPYIAGKFEDVTPRRSCLLQCQIWCCPARTGTLVATLLFSELTWEKPGETTTTFFGDNKWDPGWSPAQRQQLIDTVELIRSGGDTNLPAAPPLARIGADGDLAITYLAEADAWRYFVA